MTITRGGSKHNMRAPNYISDEARARMAEVVPPAQEKLKNALNVDRYLSVLFLKQPSATRCTCQYTTVTRDELGDIDYDERKRQTVMIPGTTHAQIDVDEIVMDSGRPLFGDYAAFDPDADEDDERYEFNEDDETQVETLIDSPECGICYKTAFVPGFELFGKRRYVLTTYDIAAESFIHIDRAFKPNLIKCLDPNKSWVEFDIDVPKYFQEVRYSVRNNHELLDDKLFVGQTHLTVAYLNLNRGGTVRIRCKAHQFTHVDITFDLNSEPLYTNIAQFSKITDWTQIETLSNITVVFPTRIPELVTGSYVWLPEKNVMLKVTDVQYLREHTNKNINWEVTCRVLQPQEKVRNIHKGFKLL